MAPRSMHLRVRLRKLSNFRKGLSSDGLPNELIGDLLSRAPLCFEKHGKFRQHLQSLAPTNLHWAREAGYGPFS
jgi:hypothetical protein